ncbi:MAG TPA: hypothetical protein VGB97_00805 [Candidatus Paceibacterota bacterium]|jgi:hypothetical protein
MKIVTYVAAGLLAAIIALLVWRGTIDVGWKGALLLIGIPVLGYIALKFGGVKIAGGLGMAGVAVFVAYLALSGSLGWWIIPLVILTGLGLFIGFLVLARLAKTKGHEDGSDKDQATGAEAAPKKKDDHDAHPKRKGFVRKHPIVALFLVLLIIIGAHIVWTVVSNLGAGTLLAEGWKIATSHPSEMNKSAPKPGHAQGAATPAGEPDEPAATEEERAELAKSKYLSPPLPADGRSETIYIRSGFQLRTEPGMASGIHLMECFYTDHEPKRDERGRQWTPEWQCPDAKWVTFQTAADMLEPTSIRYCRVPWESTDRCTFTEPPAISAGGYFYLVPMTFSRIVTMTRAPNSMASPTIPQSMCWRPVRRFSSSPAPIMNWTMPKTNMMNAPSASRVMIGIRIFSSTLVMKASTGSIPLV